MTNYFGGKDVYVKIGDGEGGNLGVAGIITGGSHDIDLENEVIRGVGSAKVIQVRPGLIRPSGNIDFDLQNADLLLKAKRGANDVLPEFSIDAGTHTAGKVHKHCKCSDLSLDLAFKSKVSGSLSWLGLQAETGAHGSHTPDAGLVYMWYEAVIDGLTAIKVRSISLRISHELDIEGAIRDRGDDKEREGDYVTEGDQTIEANIKLFKPLDVDITADALAEIASATITLSRGDDDIVITLTGITPKKDEHPLSLERLIEFGADFDVRDWDVTPPNGD